MTQYTESAYRVTHTIHVECFVCCSHILCSGLQCIPVAVSACAAVFHQPYYIPVADREESETFASITSISDQLDPFCSTVLTKYACHFITPPCDPEKGLYSK